MSDESISSCVRVRDLDRDIVEQCRGREIFRLNVLKEELEAVYHQQRGGATA